MLQNTVFWNYHKDLKQKLTFIRLPKKCVFDKTATLKSISNQQKSKKQKKKSTAGKDFEITSKKLGGSLSQVDVNESTMKRTLNGNDVAGLQEKIATRPRFVADQLFKLLGNRNHVPFINVILFNIFGNSRENAIFKKTVLSFHYTINNKESPKKQIHFWTSIKK